MTAAPRPVRYAWAGGGEWSLRFGPDHGPVVVLLLPLFEEAGRTRALAAAIARALAGHGIGAVLPDLPGTGDSLEPTEAITLLKLRKAVRELVAALDRDGRRPYLSTIRSGALLDASALAFGRWQLSPQTGADVRRDLGRILKASGGSAAALAGGDGPPVTVAGNAVPRALLADLADAVPMTASEGVRVRLARYMSESRPADLKLPGTAPWRRAEPGHDADTAGACADDIAAWVRACEG